jgi:ATP-dependent Zn protease
MFRNRQSYLDEICTLLAGIAAEEFVLGTFGDGAGGGRGSDLERATDVATQIETQFGMGKTVRHTIARDAYDLEQVRRGDPDLRERIERIVDEQFQRAKNIVAADEGLLNLLTEELVAKGGCTPASFETLLERDATSQTPLPDWQALGKLGSYSWKTHR